MHFFLAIFNKKPYLCTRKSLKTFKTFRTFKPLNMLPTVALIYDFDGTLAPGNMQEFGLLQAIGYTNPAEFWNLCDQIAKTNDAGGIAVVMYAIQAEAQRAGPRCTRDMLREYSVQVFAVREICCASLARQYVSFRVSLSGLIISMPMQQRLASKSSTTSIVRVSKR